MKEISKGIVAANLSPEEIDFIDRILDQLKKEGYEGLTREGLIEILVKAGKTSGIELKEFFKQEEQPS